MWAVQIQDDLVSDLDDPVATTLVSDFGSMTVDLECSDETSLTWHHPLCLVRGPVRLFASPELKQKLIAGFLAALIFAAGVERRIVFNNIKINDSFVLKILSQCATTSRAIHLLYVRGSPPGQQRSVSHHVVPAEVKRLQEFQLVGNCCAT